MLKADEATVEQVSMLAVSSNPFCPSSCSSLPETRRDLQWLAKRWVPQANGPEG